jgi:hypothetical protein
MSATMTQCSLNSNSTASGDPPWYPWGTHPTTSPYTHPWTPPTIQDPGIYGGPHTFKDTQIEAECEAMALALRAEFSDLLSSNSQTSLFITPIPPNGFLLRLTTRHGEEQTLQADSLVALYKKTEQLMRTLCEYAEE